MNPFHINSTYHLHVRLFHPNHVYCFAPSKQEALGALQLPMDSQAPAHRFLRGIAPGAYHWGEQAFELNTSVLRDREKCKIRAIRITFRESWYKPMFPSLLLSKISPSQWFQRFQSFQCTCRKRRCDDDWGATSVITTNGAVYEGQYGESEREDDMIYTQNTRRYVNIIYIYIYTKQAYPVKNVNMMKMFGEVREMMKYT